MLTCVVFRLLEGPEQHSASAIPGGHTGDGDGNRSLPWREQIPFALPERAILDGLVQQYFNSVNWFMHVCSVSTLSERD